MTQWTELLAYSLCIAGVGGAWATWFFHRFTAPKIAARARQFLRAEYIDAAKFVARSDLQAIPVPAIAYGGPMDGHQFDIPPHIVRVVFNDESSSTRAHYALAFTGDPRKGRVFTFVQP